MGLKKVIACIKKHNNFLITSHVNLEGDALGSELAFYRLLKKIGKKAIIVNEDSSPRTYSFLPGINKLNIFRKRFSGIDFDCLVVLDCSELARCGVVAALHKDNKPILNIDHHISNRRFGLVNWVETDVSSCSEMIYRVYKEMRIPIDKPAAMLLYTGIFTDTGSFRYSNTTARTHHIASELLGHNLDVPKIYNLVYGNIPFEDIRILLKILPTIKRSCSGKLAWFQIERRILGNERLSIDLSEHLMSFARAIKGVEVTVLFRENPCGEVKINFRSQGKVDVNKIASFFGGGGHKTASGCTVKGKISRIREMVLAKITRSLGCLQRK